MEITEEQRRRAEANRLAALEKRKRLAEAAAARDGEWRLSKCQKTSTTALVRDDAPPLQQGPSAPVEQPCRFRVVLEICSPDEFCVTPQPLPGFSFPGEAECLRKIGACLSSTAVLCYIEVMGQRKTSIYKLKDYETVSGHLRRLQGLQLHEVPYTTRVAIEKSSCHSAGERWTSSRAPHLSDNEVDELLSKLPNLLRDALLPFQLEGARFGLRRGGCCLIADEMGLGKTIQAIAIACCFISEGPILVICPAVLRFSWAEELEHWLPICLPTDIHLVFGHQDNVDRLEKSPKVVVISYTMLHRLRRSMLKRHWALVIVDESHNIRCTKKALECEETKAVIDVASNTQRIILLSGTPSLSRPFDIFHQINILWPKLLGKDKYEFANHYCSVRLIQNSQRKVYKDFSKGTRLEELNVLLRQTVMIRRLKEHVLTQLPPKRRQVIRLMLKGPDIVSARVACRAMDSEACSESEKYLCSSYNDDDDDDDSHDCSSSSSGGGDDVAENGENLDECNDGGISAKTLKMLSYQETGIAKLSGFCEWFTNHFMVNNTEVASSLDTSLAFQKMIVFAHHIKVLDGIQEFVCGKGIQFIRIDGSTLPRDRQMFVESFRSSKEVKIAIIGITAGGVGLDFSSAQNVVFLELPKSASEMLQAEDRAHRRGQTNAVNIYIFCAKDTSDESQWLQLNKSLYRVSSMMNGKYDAIKEIEVDRVYHLYSQGDPCYSVNPDTSSDIPEHGTSDNCGVQGHNKDSPEDCQDRCSQQTNTTMSCSAPTVRRMLEVETTNGQDRGVSVGLSVSLECKALDSLENQISGSLCLSRLGKEIGDYGSSMSEACDIIIGTDMEQTEADVDACFPADSLRFEVSRYTGRIHLYVCVLGKDSRPRPLFENFRPEEVDLMCIALDTRKEVGQQLVKRNAAYWEVFNSFIKEWNGLRPIEQKKLLGKPLQLPLDLELCYLKESINHGCGGLLKGGSKRRVTPSSEISCPLPENAVWKKITLCRRSTKEKEFFQAWTLNNVPLCKLCQKPCSGILAKRPEFFEDLFCNLSCFQEFRIRTSQRYLREALFQIEHGVCAMCKLDCHRLVKCMRPLSIERRQEYVLKMAPKLANKINLLDKLINEPTEGNAWHADHIVPVYKGGGECRLENMRTLCVACHSDVTATQRAEQRITRKRAKEQLRIVMKELQDNATVNLGVEQPEFGNSTQEEGLLVNVPGSAYFPKVKTADED